MNFKRIALILTITLTLFLMVSSACAGDFFDFLNSDNTKTENTNDTFIVGFNSHFPPFGYKDNNGNYTGFDLELAQEVCKRNNWTFVAQPIIDWDSKEVELNSNEIDCIWSEFTINGREDQYTWSEPYFNNTKVVIVKSDSNINTLDDLKGKIIEVQEGSSILKTLETQNKTFKDSFKEIKQVDGYDSALMDLDSGVCDAVIADYGLASYKVVTQFKDKDFKILNQTISNEQYGIGFKKGNTELRDQVQKTLDEMFKDGTVDKIAQKYSDYKLSEYLVNPNK